VDGQRQVFAGDGDQYRRLPELDRERQAIQLARETGIEVQHIVADLGALLRRAALDAVGVAAERDQESFPQAFGVERREYPA